MTHSHFQLRSFIYLVFHTTQHITLTIMMILHVTMRKLLTKLVTINTKQ